MARIDKYENDEILDDDDRVLGTDSSGKKTKNYSLKSMQEYFSFGEGTNNVYISPTFEDLPETGVDNVIYITLDEGAMFIWSEGDYVSVGGADITIDQSVQQGSANAVSGNAVYISLSAKQDADNAVTLTDDQDIEGTKTFLNPPTTPYPSDPYHIAPKIYVDNEVASLINSITLKEATQNKQETLDYDGTKVFYPTVDAVNNGFRSIVASSLENGLLLTNDTFYLAKQDAENLTVGPIQSAFFKEILLSPTSSIVDCVKSFPLTVIPLNSILISGAPLSPDGAHILYLGIDKNGQFIWSKSGFLSSDAILYLGIISVNKQGPVTTFLASRDIITSPMVASYSSLERAMLTGTTTCKVVPSGALKMILNEGEYRAVSVNWSGPGNRNILQIPGQNPAQFEIIHPLIFNSLFVLPVVTDLDFTQYFDPLLQSVEVVPAGWATVQKVVLTRNGKILVQMGEEVYPTLDEAYSAVTTAPFTPIDPVESFIEIARIVALKETVDTSNPDECIFYSSLGGGTSGSASGSAVDSVNGKIGVVVLNPDDLDDAGTAHKFASTAEKNTWNGKQDSIPYTTENVANKSISTALGASDTLYPSQNAVKTYADTKIAKNVAATYTTNAITTVTQAQYDAIGVKDPNTLYFITA